MNSIYFSGTGNTKHCAEKLTSILGGGQSAALETPQALELLQQSEEIILAYPIQFSNIPLIVKQFIKNNRDAFKGKKVFIVCTMGLFSGDGAGLSARLLKKCSAKILGGLHLRYPDCIGDEKMLKKTLEEDLELIRLADQKLENAAAEVKNGKYPKDGLSFFHLLAGLFGQRLWFLKKASSIHTKLKIDAGKCSGCTKCADNCPTNSIEMKNGKAYFNANNCTTCYRCVNNCPAKAITLLGTEVFQQCTFENYMKGRI